jgi:hypothetical protein
MAPATRAGSVPLNGESMRTVPVNQSADPLLDGCEPFRLISINQLSLIAISIAIKSFHPDLNLPPG